MALILDSSVLIAGERRGHSIRQVLHQVRANHGDTEAALSAVTVVELTHGIYRAKTEADRARRRAFAEEIYHDMIVHPDRQIFRALARLSSAAGQGTLSQKIVQRY
jgi:tRNA(fMet)-specific endonuclease VapC